MLSNANPASRTLATKKLSGSEKMKKDESVPRAFCPRTFQVDRPTLALKNLKFAHSSSLLDCESAAALRLGLTEVT